MCPVFTYANHISMTTPSPYAKDLGNLLYHSAIVGGLSVGYSMVGKRLLKMKPAELGRLDIEDSAKLIRTVALALWTKHMLVKWDHPCKHHQKHIAAKIVILKHCHVSGMDMMAAIGMMVGGAVVNALAFTGVLSAW